MRAIVPAIAVIASTTLGVVAGVTLRGRGGVDLPESVAPGVGRCTSDARCTFEDEHGALSPARSTVRAH
jgi:hypothetical protein